MFKENDLVYFHGWQGQIIKVNEISGCGILYFVYFTHEKYAAWLPERFLKALK